MPEIVLPAGAKLAANIEGWLALASDAEYADGLAWYALAHRHAEHIAKAAQLSVPQSAAIIALLSPAQSWENNVRNALLLASHDVGAGPHAGTYPAQAHKARAVRDRHIMPDDAFSWVTAPKTASFYHNIVAPNDPAYVTIDRHATRVALGAPDAPVTLADAQATLRRRGTYEALREAYTRVAQAHGLVPNQAQAITWEVFRRRHGGRWAAGING